jgi:hypothetical protein
VTGCGRCATGWRSCSADRARRDRDDLPDGTPRLQDRLTQQKLDGLEADAQQRSTRGARDAPLRRRRAARCRARRRGGVALERRGDRAAAARGSRPGSRCRGLDADGGVESGEVQRLALDGVRDRAPQMTTIDPASAGRRSPPSR